MRDEQCVRFLQWALPRQSAPFRLPLFQERRNRVLRKIREFSRIEKRASAGRAFFVLDVRLLWIDPAQHAAIASGATVAVEVTESNGDHVAVRGVLEWGR
jgi:hypothetical protein